MPTATSVVGLAAEFQDLNYRQCWDYAAMLAARANAAAECVVVTRSGVPAGLASVCVKRLPHMRTGIAYVAGGPLVRHREDTSARERLDRAGRADAGVGASNDLGRATNAAYLLQWKVIEAASRAACRRYDLGGVDPEGNPGLYRFKQSDGRHRAVRARPV